MAFNLTHGWPKTVKKLPNGRETLLLVEALKIVKANDEQITVNATPYGLTLLKLKFSHPLFSITEIE